MCLGLCSCVMVPFGVVFLDLCVAMWVSDQTRSREFGNSGTGLLPSVHASLTGAQHATQPSSITKGSEFTFVC